MLAELNSAKALFAVVFGVPVAVLVAAGVWLIPTGRPAARGVVSVLMAVLVGIGIWTVFQSSGQRVEASPPLAGSNSNAPLGMGPQAPAPQPSTQAPPSATPAAPGATCKPSGSQVAL
ncbi:MAG TPA: hypothetical protein VF660_00005, partial [Actinomycetota bacterium]